MTVNELQALAGEGRLFLDGATVSNLLTRGMPPGVCPEQWILGHEEILIGLQREFVEAGSRILYAPTFSANRLKLSEYGLEDAVGGMNRGLVAIAREAAGDRAYVAGDLTMTGRQLAPAGPLDFEELIEVYKEQIGYLAGAGVDLLAVETMMSLQECRAALIAAKETCDLPVMVTMTFEQDGRTLYGTDAETAAVVLSSLGAAAVGANCSTGPDQMKGIIRSMARVASVPIIAKPNAGLPSLNSRGETVYSMDSETFGREMDGLAEAGASILGGCCGTTPDYIRSLKENVRFHPAAKPPSCVQYLASETRTLSFGPGERLLIIGERINPTGKKKLQASLRDKDMEMVRGFAAQQQAAGADLLDINMGMSGVDEKELMRLALSEVPLASSLPLALDSSHVEVLEEALRRYPGRALINSISGESAKTDVLLALARKYGAMFILLPLSDAGLPKDLEEKKKIIHEILEKAYSLGLGEKDIVVDGLAATVGANPGAALELLDTIRYCSGRGLATVCGLSNISFGLPERGYVNAAFLTMAMEAGLTMAIANPSQELLMCSKYAADLLLRREGADINYIEAMERYGQAGPACGSSQESAAGRIKDAGKTSEAAPASGDNRPSGNAPDLPALHTVYDSVLKGNRRHIVEYTGQALNVGIPPKDVLDYALLPAINQVGDYFDQGRYFLPQLIAGAEAMKSAIEYLEPYLAAEEEAGSMPTMVIATVKGDIHDIGKNLVALMLKNYGFQVIDLGKDVPGEQIVRTAIEQDAAIIGLSALMTTTMQEMRHVIDYAKEQGARAKVIIGGAVITQEFADEIGADGYAKDAADAVRVAKRLLGI